MDTHLSNVARAQHLLLNNLVSYLLSELFKTMRSQFLCCFPSFLWKDPRNRAFGKPCPCPRDTRHFVIFVVSRGSSSKALVLLVRMQIRHFRHFRQTPPFSGRTKAWFTKRGRGPGGGGPGGGPGGGGRKFRNFRKFRKLRNFFRNFRKQ